MRSKIIIASLLIFSTLIFFSSFLPYPVEQTPHAYNFKYSSTYSTPEIPKDNPMTEEGVQLGRMLFYDPELSVNNKISCGSCHQQKLFFSDGLARAIGVHGDTLRWHTINLLNLAWEKRFFWNGRDTSLEQVVKDHINNPVEMGALSETDLIGRLKSHKLYQELFRRAFPKEAMCMSTVSKAIAQFTRIIVSKYTYVPEEYKSKAGMFGSDLLKADTYASSVARVSLMKCKSCHGTEAGGQMLAVYANDSMYKAPNLVNIRFSGPYMHDGRFKTLKEVYRFYNISLEDIAAKNMALLGKEEVPALFTEYDFNHAGEIFSDNEDTSIISNSEYANPFIQKGFKW